MELASSHVQQPTAAMSPEAYARLISYVQELERADQHAVIALAKRAQGKNITDFDVSGGHFRAAMRHAPGVRFAEIEALHDMLLPRRGERSLEVACGAGFLTRPIWAWTNNDIWALDPSVSQLRALRHSIQGNEMAPYIHTIRNVPDDPYLLRKRPLKDLVGQLDFVTGLAGVHHVDNQNHMLKNMAGLIKPREEGGRIVFADVAANSKEARYLDDPRAERSITGHRGNYLSASLSGLSEICENTGLVVTSAEVVATPWRFDGWIEMPLFAWGIHRLKAQVRDVFEISQRLQEVKWKFEDDLSVTLMWRLLVVRFEKPALSVSITKPELLLSKAA